jgi:hypothetical protein
VKNVLARTDGPGISSLTATLTCVTLRLVALRALVGRID